MSPDEFMLALRALAAPLLLDDQGSSVVFGTAYAATTVDGARVVVLQLSPALNRLVGDPDRFLQTIERYDYRGAGVTTSGQLYVVEPLVVGESLATMLARSGPIASAELMPIARSAARRLATLHEAFGAHGMITPSTVYAGADGTVQLRWPGLVPALCTGGANLMAIGHATQSASWIAPETNGSGAVASLGPSLDVFGLGATLYTALTGRPPFGGRTTATVMATVLADDTGTRTTSADVLTRAVLRAIEHRAEDRWHDAAQLVDALVESPVTPLQTTIVRRTGCFGRLTTAAVLFATLLVLWSVAKYIS